MVTTFGNFACHVAWDLGYSMKFTEQYFKDYAGLYSTEMGNDASNTCWVMREYLFHHDVFKHQMKEYFPKLYASLLTAFEGKDLTDQEIDAALGLNLLGTK